jgi:cytochrome c biogenesis protein CcmG/thiol:disulfide interchange protein DsbE
MVKTDRVLNALLVIAVAALVVVAADTMREKVVVVGDSAPDFTIRTDTGLSVSPTNFGGQVLVLNFWATWCPPCIREMPSLDQFHRLLRDSGVVVLAISVDKNERTYRNFLDRVKVSFLTARDPEARISGSFGTYRYPETYVIDRTGKVVQKVIADTDWSDENMIRFVKSLL